MVHSPYHQEGPNTTPKPPERCAFLFQVPQPPSCSQLGEMVLDGEVQGILCFQSHEATTSLPITGHRQTCRGSPNPPHTTPDRLSTQDKCQGWLLGWATCAGSWGPAVRHLHLVLYFAVAILKFFTMFEQRASIFILHRTQQIL